MKLIYVVFKANDCNLDINQGREGWNRQDKILINYLNV